MPPIEPYLDGDAKRLFDAWHEAARRRFERDLTFPEIRKGVQALSALYVGRRGRLADAASVFDGAGKRAAFALFFAPLHLFAAWHAVREIGFDAEAPARIWDLGCGTGAGGAAWGAAIAAAGSERTKIVGADRSLFALEEAALTYRAFGLKAETKRIDLGAPAAGPVVGIGRPGKASRPKRRAPGGIRPDDGILLAWTANEIGDAAREALLADLLLGAGTRRPLLVLEPVAKGIAPWWSRWESALGAEAVLLHSFEWRKRLELPGWIAEMDHAAGLDHAELTARVLGVVG